MHAYNRYTNVELSTKELRHFKGDPVFKSFAPFYSTLNQCVLPPLKYVFQNHNFFSLYFPKSRIVRTKIIALKIKINHILWRKKIAYYQSLKLNAIARNNIMLKLESEIGLFRSKYFCNRNVQKENWIPRNSVLQSSSLKSFHQRWLLGFGLMRQLLVYSVYSVYT